MAVPTLGYHAERSLALKTRNVTIAYGQNCCTACVENINWKTNLERMEIILTPEVREQLEKLE